MRRLVEAELLFQLLDEVLAQSLRAAIFRVRRIELPGALQLARAEIAAGRAGDARGRAGVGAGKLRDHPLDRAAGRELDHHERDQHDAEQGRDHEQHAADQIGRHVNISIFRQTRFAAVSALKRSLSSGSLDLGRLVAVIPPSFRYATGVARFRRSRPAENVPVGDPGRRFVPVRHPVSPGPQHAVERLAGGHELGRGCRPR